MTRTEVIKQILIKHYKFSLKLSIRFVCCITSFEIFSHFLKKEVFFT